MEPTPAATVIVAQPGAEGVEVLLLRRAEESPFATGAAGGLEPVPDGSEITDAWWARPEEVLGDASGGDVPLMWPTRVTLEALTGCRAVSEVLALRLEQVPRTP